MDPDGLMASNRKREPGWLGSVLANKAERFNTISALFGAVFAVIGVVWLVGVALRQGDPWKVASFSIYGLTLILVYVFATLYHASDGQAKAIFSKLDHLSIYLLIAGTYTPFTLITLRESVGWQVFGAIWGMALLGIMLDLLPNNGKRVLQVILYLAMGWLIVFALNPLMQAIPTLGFYCIFSGGMFYTVGVVFYALDDKVSYFHGIWHLFVLSGSLIHYVAVLRYVA